jgi:hypothetical protein
MTHPGTFKSWPYDGVRLSPGALPGDVGLSEIRSIRWLYRPTPRGTVNKFNSRTTDTR